VVEKDRPGDRKLCQKSKKRKETKNVVPGSARAPLQDKESLTVSSRKKGQEDLRHYIEIRSKGH